MKKKQNDKGDKEKKTKKHKPRKEPTYIIPISVSLKHPGYPEIAKKPPSAAYTYRRIFYLSLQAIFNAIIIGGIAKVLIVLIDLITNIAFYGKFSLEYNPPGIGTLGWMVIFIPVIGGLIVGIMARYGAEGIRGHGIPEAMERILMNESKIKPIITFLKPISSAIAIGTGGPFGAEGPIISTGGALGSVAGQVMRINATERKIMLSAGACAGMAAVFGCPIAGILMGIELLLFEFSPRSIIPVALSCATGAAMHYLLFGTQPIFAMPDIPIPTSMDIITYTIMGAIIGVVASYVSRSVYKVEDLFNKLPMHWMWWPAIGAVAVGVIGFYAPETMGVGYNNIRGLLSGNLPLTMLLSLCFLKCLSWVIALASGTSGGTLAPLFTIGGGLGALLAVATVAVFPGSDINIATAAMVGMAAMFAGASRAVLTSIVFLLETTGQMHGLLPLVGGCTAAYLVSFFIMKGSIMTEKMERHGITPPGTFEPDILEQLLIKEVFSKKVSLIAADNTVKEAREWIKANAEEEQFGTFIIVDKEHHFMGLVQRFDIFSKKFENDEPITSLMKDEVAYIYPNNQLSLAVDLMDKFNIDTLPVVSRTHEGKVLGMVSRASIFAIYHKRKDEEELHKQTLSVKNRGMRMIVRGRQMFGR